MLYLFHGTKTQDARAKVNSLVDALLKKKPDALFFKIDDEHFDAGELEEYIAGQGLFENKFIVVLDGIFQNKEAKEIFLAKLKEIAVSENIFILLEGEIDKRTLNRLKKKTEKDQLFGLASAPKKRKGRDNSEFNIFSLTDAFGTRDKKLSWVRYQEAVREGVSPEEIHGILSWQVKNLLSVKNIADAKSLNLNPFVLRKSLGFSKQYNTDELKELSWNLVAIYHNTRRGRADLGIGLEQFLLGI